MLGRSRNFLLASLAIAAGVAARMNPITRQVDPKGTALGWRRPRNVLWQSSPVRIAAAPAKRERRGQVVRRNVAAGAYGLRPFAGTKGYVPNTPHGAASLRIVEA